MGRSIDLRLIDGGIPAPKPNCLPSRRDASKQRPYHELESSISYDIMPQLTVYVQGSNLLDSATQRYSTYNNVPAFYEYTGRAFFFGVRARI